MPDGFDEALQRGALLIVYNYELWLLPPFVAWIIFAKGRAWAWPLRTASLFLLLAYVIAYEMDRYSFVAAPLLALAFATDAVRDFWYHALGGPFAILRSARGREARRAGPTGAVPPVGAESARPPPELAAAPLQTPASGTAHCQSATRASKIWWRVELIVVVFVFVYFHAPLQLLTFVGTALLIVLLPSVLSIWRNLAERRFRRELQADPRLGRYLAWVRVVRERAREDSQSLLAENWLWTPRYVSRPRGLKLWLARRLSPKRWRLMTIESTFVLHNLLRERDLVWRELAARYYTELANFTSAALSIAQRPAFDDKESLVWRSRWLAMTEAAAECLAFNDEIGADPSGKRPDWLTASELLAHAGEAELEFLIDLTREARGANKEARPQLEESIARHRQRAAGYFDLSACCIENYFEPASRRRGRPLLERWRRVAGESASWRPGQPVFDSGSREDAIWRAVLMLRFQLLGLLIPEEGAGLATVGDVVTTPADELAVDNSFAALKAALARDAAETAFWLVKFQGDPGSRWALDECRIGADRLQRADYWRTRLKAAERSVDGSDWLAEESLRRVLHLWGLAIEQDLDVLFPGKDIWRDRLDTAADIYIFEGSLRVKWLAALFDVEKFFMGPIDSIVELA
jgi:hypothetical protein